MAPSSHCWVQPPPAQVESQSPAHCTPHPPVGQVNALLSDTRAAPWLTRHPEMPEWHLHLASIHDPLAQRMGAEMAMALADVVRVGELRRLKICAAPDCEAVLIDLSRNRSRMFCDTGNCGNRQHVAAYRERRSKEVDEPVDD